MKHALTAMFFLLLTGSVAAQQRYATYSSARCGIRFDYPAHWRVVPEPKPPSWIVKELPRGSARCAFGVRPPGWDAKRRADTTGMLQPHPVMLVLFRATFEAVTLRAGFTHYTAAEFPEQTHWEKKVGEGGWLIGVRQGDEKAEQTRTSCCQLVIGDTWGHAWDEHDNVYTVTSTLAVVNDYRRNTLYIEGQSADRFHAIVLAIAKSFRTTR